MFNRQYHPRAARLALARIGLECAPDPESGFYRPAKRPDPRLRKPAKPGAREQLHLDFEAETCRNAPIDTKAIAVRPLWFS
jgi:hypothetical protein